MTEPAIQSIKLATDAVAAAMIRAGSAPADTPVPTARCEGFYAGGQIGHGTGDRVGTTRMHTVMVPINVRLGSLTFGE